MPQLVTHYEIVMVLLIILTFVVAQTYGRGNFANIIYLIMNFVFKNNDRIFNINNKYNLQNRPEHIHTLIGNHKGLTFWNMENMR